MDSRLREVVMGIVAKYGDKAHENITMRDWDIDTKERALLMISVVPRDTYMVEMGEINIGELDLV